ncbi:MAG: hypothetical protein CL546_01665 [Alcanivorax sp.]|nr:hypothetical protein [Alcanivorax sp.]
MVPTSAIANRGDMNLFNHDSWFFMLSRIRLVVMRLLGLNLVFSPGWRVGEGLASQKATDNKCASSNPLFHDGLLIAG